MAISVYAIHGVDHQKPGEIATLIRTRLGRELIGVEVREFNWSTLAEAPEIGAAIKPSLLVEVVNLIHNSAFIESRSTEARSGQGVGLSTMCFEVGRTLILVALSSILSVPFVLWGMLLPVDLEATRYRDWFSGYWEILKWTGIAGFLRASFVADASVALVKRQARYIAVNVRRTLLITMVPLLTIGGIPFLLKWSEHKTRVLWFIVTLGGIHIAAIFGIALVEYALHLPGQPYLTITEAMTATGRITLIVVTIVITVLCIASLAVVFVPYTTKALLDILRYTGDQHYRARLLEALETDFADFTRKLSESDCLYLLGHSLGSVIALDFLLNRLTHPPHFRLVLVTGGSPIKRFFGNFYPSQFFPASPSHSATILTANIPGFQWLNIFRPLDPIGSYLGFPLLSCGRDINSRQRVSWLNAHLDYWGDRHLLTLIRREMSLIEKYDRSVSQSTPRTCKNGSKAYYVPSQDYINPILRRLAKYIPVAAGIGMIGLLSWVSIGLIYQTASLIHERHSEFLDLQANGVRTIATVIHHRFILPNVPGHSPMQFDDIFEITYKEVD